MTKHILLAVAAALLLAACDDNPAPLPASDPPTKERPFTDPDRR